MLNSKRIGAVTICALLLSAGSATGAAAAPSGDPNVTRTANPASSCAAIPGTLAQFGLTADGFNYASCVQDLAGRVPLTYWGGNSYEQCAALEEGIETPGGFFRISYPYTFHAEAGDPFPNLRAYNREQCARALWTFHTIESCLPHRPRSRAVFRRTIRTALSASIAHFFEHLTTGNRIVEAYWVPMRYIDSQGNAQPVGFPIESRQGCISTLARGLTGGAVDAARFSLPAASSQCHYLEETFGITYPPLLLYGQYEARNRTQCAHILQDLLAVMPPPTHGPPL